MDVKIVFLWVPLPTLDGMKLEKPAIFVWKGQIPTILTQQQQCSHKVFELCLLCNCKSPSHTQHFFLCYSLIPKYIQFIFVNILKKKKKISGHFLQILAKNPSKLRNYMNTSIHSLFLPHVFGRFHSFLFAAPLIFRSLQRCSIRFQSGLWLGHSMAFTELFWSNWAIDKLGSVFGIIVLLKDEPSPQSGVRLSSRMFLYIAAFIIPSILTSLPVPAAGNMPTPWCCHHHALL